MEHSRLVFLLDRHHKNVCSPVELAELENWYDTLASDTDSFEKWVEKAGSEQALVVALFDEFKVRNGATIAPVRHSWTWQSWTRLAAALAGAVFLLGLGYQWFEQTRNVSMEMMSFSAPADTGENRYFILPDSSRVLLHAGSRLDLRTKNGDKREFSLVGEAHFDVRHDKNRPFIVHTGQVKTTVLGTEFNIRAYGGQDQVTVSVNRGKVSVESNEKLLGILTQNQQITYNSKSQQIREQTIDEQVLAASDGIAMDFENLSFGKIAEKLGRRYGVSIRIANPALRGCPITATFRGTETLTEILEVITTTRGATFDVDKHGKNIVIQGDGCTL